MPIKIGQQPDHSFDEPLGLLSDCHRRIEHFLHVIEVIAARDAHLLTAAERLDLQRARLYFATAGPRHTADEEGSLFPRVRASTNPDARLAVEIIERLERDHQRADSRHAAVDTLVGDWLADGMLSDDRRSDLRVHLAELRSIYEPHIACEDRELFPAAARILTPEEVAAIGCEMAARRRT